MRNQVSEQALSFNRFLIQKLMGEAEDNSGQLAHAQKALLDILQEELTERQREVLTLYYYDGMNIPEIAETLSVNRSTVSRTLQRAKQRIYKNLRFCFVSGSDPY